MLITMRQGWQNSAFRSVPELVHWVAGNPTISKLGATFPALESIVAMAFAEDWLDVIVADSSPK